MALLAVGNVRDYKAEMVRKSTPPKDTEAPARGRPPLPPRTRFARVLREQGRTVKSVAEELPAWAVKVGLPKKAAPQAKTLLDAVNGRHWPSAPLMLMVRALTTSWGTPIDLQDWVADLYE